MRNLPDGRVEVLAQAERDTLAAFCQTLREGPQAARVDEVDVSAVPVNSEMTTFRVRF